MATPSTRSKMADLLSGPVDRENAGELAQHIYESYSTFDQAHAAVQELHEDLEDASDDDRRDLCERLGLRHFLLGEYDQAAELLQEVKARKNAAYFLGLTYMKTHREEEALDLLEKGRAGEHDPQVDALTIEALCRLRRFEEAEELVGDMEVESGEEHLLQYALGRVAEAEGEYGQAMEHYEQALQHDSEHPESLFRLALNYDLNGDDERAVELYRRCVELRPTYVGALINLGILYEDRGDYYEAIDCYKRVLAIDPRHKQARLYLKDAESSLTMYIDVSRSKRLRRMEELFSLPAGSEEPGLPGGETQTLGAATPAEAARAAAEVDPELQEKLNMSVEELDLSTRSRKCMERLEVATVGDLIKHSEQELLAVPNFGATSITEVKEKLEELGLSLEEEE